MKYFKNIYNVLKDVMLYTDTRVSVVLCSLSFYVWGTLLLLPGMVIDRPFYRGLAMITTNETIWGFLFLILASVKIYSFIEIYVKNNKNRMIEILHYLVKLLCCFLTTFIFITATFQIISPPVAGDTLVVCVLAWWDFFRYDRPSYRKMYLHNIQKEE